MGLLERILAAAHDSAANIHHTRISIDLHGFAEKCNFRKALFFSLTGDYYCVSDSIGMTAETIIKALFTREFLEQAIPLPQWRCISGLTLGGFRQFFSPSDFETLSALHGKQLTIHGKPYILLIADSTADKVRIDEFLSECADRDSLAPASSSEILQALRDDMADSLPRITVNCAGAIEELLHAQYPHDTLRQNQPIHQAVCAALHRRLFSIIQTLVPQYTCISYQLFSVSFPLIREELDTVSIELISFHIRKTLAHFWGRQLCSQPLITFIP